VSEPTPEARISAGLTASEDRRRQERQALAAQEPEEPETEEQRLDRLVEKMRAEPAWYDQQPPTLKMAIGHHLRNKLRAQALFGTGDQK
jgi:hypothetical protein